MSEFSTARRNSPLVQSNPAGVKRTSSLDRVEQSTSGPNTELRTEAAALTLNPRENLTTKNFWCTSHSSVDSSRLVSSESKVVLILLLYCHHYLLLLLARDCARALQAATTLTKWGPQRQEEKD